MISRRLALSLPLALTLAGCSHEPPPARFPDIRFNTEPPIQLDVARVELVSSFQPSFHPPEVEYEFPVPPQRALENLCKDRLQAISPSSRRIARFTIVDAKVMEGQLPLKEGLKADFTTQQAQRYDGQVEIRLDIYDENGTVVRTATARAARTRTVAEDITPNERDKVWYEMSDELAHAADQVLEQYINASFYPYKH
jgi:hypothetical protein